MSLLTNILYRLSAKYPGNVQVAISDELADRREAAVADTVTRAHEAMDRLSLKIAEADRRRLIG